MVHIVTRGYKLECHTMLCVATCDIIPSLPLTTNTDRDGRRDGERFGEAGQLKWSGFSLNFNTRGCLAAVKRLLTKAHSGL